ncbi:undecaprenyl diphosphate synthase family protein [Streptomyces chartreusis]|uniref:undecaprenyl diphosphate synthase family protein n=1 Tax=Streptomyces chartreusis TaxID=1969 RepID=UPI003828C858
MKHSAELTADNTGITLTLAINHGGHADITAAARAIAAAGIDAKDITSDTVAAYLPHPDTPPIDLLIRTSGELRLSGFMLWQASYAELAFLPELWPDLTPGRFRETVASYQARLRRFGKETAS